MRRFRRTHRHDRILLDPVALQREAEDRSEPFEFLLPRDGSIGPRIPEIAERREIQLLQISKAAIGRERLELLPEPAILLETLATELSRFGVGQELLLRVGDGDDRVVDHAELPIADAFLRGLP